MKDIPYRYHYNQVSRERLHCAGLLLYQYGELWCNPDSLIEEHAQCCFEVTYILSGSGTVQTGNTAHRVRKNDCVLSLPGERHAIIPDSSDPLRFVFLGFERNRTDSSFSYLFDELEQSFREEDLRCVALQDQSEWTVRLFSELQSESPFHLQMAGYLIAELLIELIRTGSDNRQTDGMPNRFPKISDDSVLVYRLETYITRNIRSLRRLQDLELVFNYNYNYLSKRFYRVTGKHLNAFHLSCRMKEAEKMLHDGLTVTQVSEQLGYSSIHSFSRSYKQYYGRNPSKKKPEV